MANKSYEKTIIFNNINGDTYIGKYIDQSHPDWQSESNAIKKTFNTNLLTFGIEEKIITETINGVEKTYKGYENKVIIKEPSSLKFIVDSPKESSAELKWEIKPSFFNNLLMNECNYFLYNKDTLVFSSIMDNSIYQRLITNYEEIVSLKLS